MTEEISNETKKSIIQERIGIWKNTQFQAIMDLQVAKKIEDTVLTNKAMQQVKNCEIALDILQKELKALDKQ